MNEAHDDDFDKDITGDDDFSFPMRMAFAEVHEAFLAMISVGFTEPQALRFLAFCSIYNGDL